MAERRPAQSDRERWVDAVIRESQERGEFDDLPGAGRPIPGIDKPYDELWWVRQKLRDEGVSYLPPSLALRKDREDTLTGLAGLGSEARVRELLEELNERIRTVNRRPLEGPPSAVAVVDVEAVVAKWRAGSRMVEEAGMGLAAGAPAAPRRGLRSLFMGGRARRT